MASRAFFRCRACGEPVVSGAYRCPVCGIDFPTGTPGAPVSPDSPAAVDPSGPVRRPAAPPPPPPPERRETRPEDIAARLEGALGQELIVRAPEPEARDPRDGRDRDDDTESGVWSDPVDDPRRDVAQDGDDDGPHTGAMDARLGEGDDAVDPLPDGPVGSALPFDDDDDGAPADGGIAPVDAGPVAETRAAAGMDTIVPGGGRQGEPNHGADLTVAPTRARKVVVAEQVGSEVVAVGRRRSKSRSLVSTVAIAFIVLGLTGALAWYLDVSGTADLGIADAVQGVRGGGDVTVSAQDGWVVIPAQPGAVVVTADGTFRIRLDGRVYTRSGSEAVRVPISEGTSLAIRTVRSPTVATVSPAQ